MGNFTYPGKASNGVGKGLGEDCCHAEKFSTTGPTDMPKGKDEKSPGVKKASVKTPNGSFNWK